MYIHEVEIVYHKVDSFMNKLLSIINSLEFYLLKFRIIFD